MTGLTGPGDSRYFGMAFFDLLLAEAFIGFYYSFRVHRLSPALLMATLFGVLAG